MAVSHHDMQPWELLPDTGTKVHLLVCLHLYFATSQFTTFWVIPCLVPKCLAQCYRISLSCVNKTNAGVDLAMETDEGIFKGQVLANGLEKKSRLTAMQCLV